MSTEPLDKLFSLENPEAGPALPLDDAAAERLVEAALAEAFPGPRGSGGAPAAGGGAGAGGLSGAVVKAVLAGAVLVGAVGLWRARPVTHEPAIEAPRVAEVPAVPAAAEPPAPVALAVGEEVAVAPVDAGQSAQASRGARAPGAVAMPEVVLSDLELLGAANAARRERRWREADALYGKVIERFPTSTVSAVAALASGDLRLDLLGDAEGARDRFRFATTRGEAHALDAFEGLAKACSALHDKRCEDEARAAIDARGGGANEKRKGP